MNEAFLFESVLTKTCKNKLCFSLDPFQLPTKTEPTKERAAAAAPVPTRKPTVIRIPAKPEKCKLFSVFLTYSSRTEEKSGLTYQCLLLTLHKACSLSLTVRASRARHSLPVLWRILSICILFFL